jgi:hypothetical protein
VLTAAVRVGVKLKAYSCWLAAVTLVRLGVGPSSTTQLHVSHSHAPPQNEDRTTNGLCFPLAAKSRTLSIRRVGKGLYRPLAVSHILPSTGRFFRKSVALSTVIHKLLFQTNTSNNSTTFRYSLIIYLYATGSCKRPFSTHLLSPIHLYQIQQPILPCPAGGPRFPLGRRCHGLRVLRFLADQLAGIHNYLDGYGGD